MRILKELGGEKDVSADSKGVTGASCVAAHSKGLTETGFARGNAVRVEPRAVGESANEANMALKKTINPTREKRFPS